MVSNWHFADSVSAFALFARTPSLSFRANQPVPWQAAPSVTSFNYQTDCGKPGVLQPNQYLALTPSGPLTSSNALYLVLDESRTRIDGILVLDPIGGIRNGFNIKIGRFV